MRGTLRVLTSVTTAAVLAVGGLAGCSGDSGDSGGDGSSAAASASGTGSVTAPGPSGSTSPTAVAAPAGSTFVETDATGLRFAVPDDWTVFDAATITEPGNEALANELATTYGVDEAQLAEIFGQMDLMVVGPVEQEFAPNVNVVANGLTALPPATTLATELEKIGARTGTPRDETTPLGPAIVVPYRLSSGGNDVRGRSMVLEGPQGFVTVTVSHVDDDKADEIASSVLSTIGAS